jgi:predicted lipoprotein with Yx(FWY)xxD motif
MRMHGRLGYVAISLAAVAGVTACAARTATGADTLAVPAAATGTARPDAPVQQLGPREPSAAPAPAGQAGEAPTRADPIPEPTVAKTQKWVKIFGGPAATDITPPKSTTRGSHTVELNVVPSDQIGAYVADGAGRTLYRFDNDSAKPPKSTCNGDCARTWPPLLIKSPGKIYPNGINPRILGYVERADGHCQVTINGRPVYYYSGDEKPGDFHGQGLKGTWFAVTATGGKTHYLFDPPGGTQGY